MTDHATQEMLLDGTTREGTPWHVWRITIPPGVTWTPDAARGDRVIIGVTPGSHTHINTETGHERQLHREVGEAKFVGASRHAVTNTSKHTHVTMIVEFG